MPRDAYVILKGGVYTKVEGYDVVVEVDKENYFSGETYRDIFNSAQSESAGQASPGAWYPAADGQAYNTGFGASQALKARVSDEIMHIAPRFLATKQTRLKFFVKSGGICEMVFGSANSLSTSAGPVPAPGDPVSFRLDDEDGVTQSDLGSITGLVAGEIYYVRSASGQKFSVATTRDGAEIDIGGSIDAGTSLLFDCLLSIADFKPGEWKAWSTSQPLRY